MMTIVALGYLDSYPRITTSQTGMIASADLMVPVPRGATTELHRLVLVASGEPAEILSNLKAGANLMITGAARLPVSGGKGLKVKVETIHVYPS